MIQTIISSVKIYRSGADIIRRGQAELSEGDNLLKIAGLSHSVDTNTTRLFFPEGIRLLDLRFNLDASSEENKSSDRIAEKLEAIRKKIEIKQTQAELWEKNGTFTGRSQQPMTEIEAYILKLPERLEQLYQEISEMEKEQKALEKELSEASRIESLPVIEALVNAQTAGSYPFEIHAYEASAGWSSVYEIHTDAKAPLNLRMRARIRQNTGEDWENVSVSLLTGKPSGGTLPTLPTIYLNIREEAPANHMLMGARMASADMAMPPMAMMAQAGGIAPKADTITLSRIETEEATVSSEETMDTYLLPAAKTIPSGSSGTMADLQQFELPCEYRLASVPKLDNSAYLIATIKTNDIPPVVHGNASIYLSGIYTGTTLLEPELTEESTDITLDKDESIRLRRIEKSKKTSGSLIKGTKSTDYVYEITATNTKDTAITLHIQDQIPVSQDKTISVDLISSDRAALDPDTGFLTWKLSLAPREAKTISFSYRVSWPKDKKLSPSSQRVSSSGRFCPTCGAKVEPGLKFCPECGTPMAR